MTLTLKRRRSKECSNNNNNFSRLQVFVLSFSDRAFIPPAWLREEGTFVLSQYAFLVESSELGMCFDLFIIFSQ